MSQIKLYFLLEMFNHLHMAIAKLCKKVQSILKICIKQKDIKEKIIYIYTQISTLVDEK